LIVNGVMLVLSGIGTTLILLAFSTPAYYVL
jgi:hypothetical protein